MAHKVMPPQFLALLTAILLFANQCIADELFSKKIGPLLERKCLTCHNSQEKKGDFSLQTRDEILSSGFVVAGKPDESHLLSLLVPESPDKKPLMPRDGAPLKPEEVALLREWITAGAVWPDAVTLQASLVDDFNWWSCLPLQKHQVPLLSCPCCERRI